MLLIVLGVISLLGAIGAGGGLGERVAALGQALLGRFAPIISLAIGALGVGLLFPGRFSVKGLTVVGLALVVFGLPALIPESGGLIGRGIADLFIQLVGPIGSAILVIALILIGAMLAFNVSLGKLLDRGERSDDAPVKPVVNEPGTAAARVSVFETVQRAIAGRGRTGSEVGPATGNRLAPGPSAPRALITDWEFPPLDLLELPKVKASAGNVAKAVETIQKTLKDFGIDVTMGDVNIGPTVTQYTLKPAVGVAVNQLTARSNDLALALAAHPIRIEAPIPGKAAVGIEVPNKIAGTVTLREIMETDLFSKARGPLTIALGRDVAGAPIIADLTSMPHLLIAGSTGSGKSIAINAILTALLYRNSPNDLRLVLVDPKRVEFTPYNELPHLLAPVVIEPDKTVNVLKWALGEMDRRFRSLQGAGSRDIGSYNATDEGKANPLPYLVIVIDELADLMQQSAKEVEGAIVRLAQLARAVGIHLIVATQRPSVDVITGLIKANILTRMAFAVASQADSRTILDQGGAEKLLGKGDMLFESTEYTKPKRVQGALISEREIREVTNFFKARHSAQYDETVVTYQARGMRGGPGGDGEVDDDLFTDAKQLVIDAGKASASLLQRRLRVGYARAARLLDLLEEQGVIGPADGARPRDVYPDQSGGMYGGSPSTALGGTSGLHPSYDQPPRAGLLPTSTPPVNPNQGTQAPRAPELPSDDEQGI